MCEGKGGTRPHIVGHRQTGQPPWASMIERQQIESPYPLPAGLGLKKGALEQMLRILGGGSRRRNPTLNSTVGFVPCRTGSPVSAFVDT